MKQQGENLTLASNTGNLTKAYHVFGGWNTQANGEGTDYAEGASYSLDAPLVLYAKWNYLVSYDANGGTRSASPASQTKLRNVDLTLADRGTMARTGYTFQGWYTTPYGAGGAAYSEAATYSANAPLTLYAQWQIITYYVSYNANEGTGISSPSSQVKLHDIHLTLASRGSMMRTGSAFSGWNTAANGSGTAYTEGGTYTANAAVTLYAQWTTGVFSIRVIGTTISGGGASSTEIAVCDSVGNNRSIISSVPLWFYGISDSIFTLYPAITTNSYFVVSWGGSTSSVTKTFDFRDISGAIINQVTLTATPDAIAKSSDADTTFYLFYYNGTSVIAMQRP